MDTLGCFMRQILFLGAVMCLTASANLMLEYNWPAPDPNINRFPHESSCHYYYLMLSEDDISIEKCPDGQLFDYVKHSCISEREKIHCWSRHFAKINHGHLIMKHKKHFKCPYPWGKYPHLHNCTKYHLCLNGKSSVKKCAPFELFDKISRKCIASIDAICADKTDVVEHGYICPKTWGSFTYSKDCSKYYECLQRKPSLRTCQKGYLFDDRLAKCAPKEHIYCGLRHNPYEKESNEVPETPYDPSATSTQKSTPLDLNLSTILEKEEIASVKSIYQEPKLTQQQTSSTYKGVTSFPHGTSSTLEKVTSIQDSVNQQITGEISSTSSVPETNNIEIKQESRPENHQTSGEFSSPLTVTESNNIEINEGNRSANQQVASEVSSLSTTPDSNSIVINLESRPANQQVTSKVSSISTEPKNNNIEMKQERKPSNQQITSGISNPSTGPETNNIEILKMSSIATASPKVLKSERQQKSSNVADNVSGNSVIHEALNSEKEQIMSSPQMTFNDESENLKKAVSTEEKDKNIISTKLVTFETQGNERASEDSSVSSSRTGCLPDDLMCTTEKDGTVVKCSSSKDLQPHPKDERRFLDCTASKIQIYTCPPNLTFHSDKKKCKWQFIL